MSKRIILLLIFLVALTFYSAFNAYIPITDPVESNYALTAKEMVQSGDWLSPRIYGHYWFDKPIMIYWLIAASFKIFGITEFAARFPSAIFSAASVAFIYWFGNRLFHNIRVALLSAMVLATSLEFWILGRMIITDAVLFFYTSLSLATLYLGMIEKKYLFYIVAYVAAALAVLTKGPVGIVLPGIIIISYILLTRQWNLFKRLYLLSGVLLFLLVAGPWYWVMFELHGNDFITTFLGLHNYVRATVSEHPSDNVFYYYLVLFPISMLPWTGILFRYLKIVGNEIKSPHLLYLAIWPIIILVFYSLMATKYLTYVFPASFPVALLIGHTLGKMQTMHVRKNWWWLSIPTLLLIGIFALSSKFLPIAANWSILYLAAAVSSVLILWLQLKGNVYHMPKAVTIVTIVMTLLLIQSGLVPVASTRSTKDIVASLPTQGAIVGSYGDYTTSAVFYSGYTISRLVHEEQKDEQNAWSGKYTMPTAKISTFDANATSYPMSYILVKDKNQDQFIKEPFSTNFYPIAHHNNTTLYKKQ